MAQVPNVDVEFDGDGATTIFDFDFPYQKQDEIFVSVNDVLVPYTWVAGSTHSVQVIPAPALNTRVRIYRSTRAYTPLYLFAGGVPFLPRYVDENAKQLLYALQEGVNLFEGVAETAQDRLNRAVRAVPTEPVLDFLPAPADRAGKLLSFNGEGQPITVAPAGGSATELALALAAPDGHELVGGVLSTDDPVLFKGENLDPVAGSSLGRGASFRWDISGAGGGSFRAGGSDLTDLNDELNYWRGLPSRNAWGDPANIGFCSAAFNRNSATPAAYSSGFGHDCVTYGTASAAFGAGSCTGNPDLWKLGGPDAAFTGYCSLAFGKNVYVPGQKAVGLGEAHTVNTRAGFGIGYRVEGQGSVATPDPVGAGGIGREVTTQGAGYGFGAYLSASDSMVLGYGANPGSPLQGQSLGEVGIGSGTTVAALRVQPPVAGQTRSKVLVNTTRSSGFVADNSEVTVSLGDGKALAITGDGFGIYDFELRGLKGDGTSQPIVRMRWSNPNSGSSAGEFSIYMNGRSTSAMSILENGTVRLSELKNATTISGSPVGSLYQDGGVMKVVI